MPIPSILGVIKPKGPTSFWVIQRLRMLTGEKTIGHAGTLDPLASGVLVVAIGRTATRTIHEVVSAEKEYLATIRLGATSTTDDEEGEKIEKEVTNAPTEETLRNALAHLTGEIMQIPPQFSAIKIKGKRAYKNAREGKETLIAPRPAIVKEIEIIEYAYPFVRLRIVTGKGVYIRAIARDLGVALGTGGYLTALERTRVGSFTKESSFTLEEIEAKVRSEKNAH